MLTEKKKRAYLFRHVKKQTPVDQQQQQNDKDYIAEGVAFVTSWFGGQKINNSNNNKVVDQRQDRSTTTRRRTNGITESVTKRDEEQKEQRQKEPESLSEFHVLKNQAAAMMYCIPLTQMQLSPHDGDRKNHYVIQSSMEEKNVLFQERNGGEESLKLSTRTADDQMKAIHNSFHNMDGCGRPITGGNFGVPTNEVVETNTTTTTTTTGSILKSHASMEYRFSECLGSHHAHHHVDDKEILVQDDEFQGGEAWNGFAMNSTFMDHVGVQSTAETVKVGNGVNRNDADDNNNIDIPLQIFGKTGEVFEEEMELLRVLPVDYEEIGVPVTIERDWSRFSVSTMSTSSRQRRDDIDAEAKNESMELVLGSLVESRANDEKGCDQNYRRSNDSPRRRSFIDSRTRSSKMLNRKRKSKKIIPGLVAGPSYSFATLDL
jgi:hypothetical protein